MSDERNTDHEAAVDLADFLDALLDPDHPRHALAVECLGDEVGLGGLGEWFAQRRGT